ncbi:MAG: hypothetical protein KC502_14675 [Myxococcales bacterium]|nr:hypothetical protein [Myxococcales bacterium]
MPRALTLGTIALALLTVVWMGSEFADAPAAELTEELDSTEPAAAAAQSRPVRSFVKGLRSPRDRSPKTTARAAGGERRVGRSGRPRVRHVNPSSSRHRRSRPNRMIALPMTTIVARNWRHRRSRYPSYRHRSYYHHTYYQHRGYGHRGFGRARAYGHPGKSAALQPKRAARPSVPGAFGVPGALGMPAAWRKSTPLSGHAQAANGPAQPAPTADANDTTSEVAHALLDEVANTVESARVAVLQPAEDEVLPALSDRILKPIALMTLGQWLRAEVQALMAAPSDDASQGSDAALVV